MFLPPQTTQYCISKGMGQIRRCEINAAISAPWVMVNITVSESNGVLLPGDVIPLTREKDLDRLIQYDGPMRAYKICEGDPCLYRPRSEQPRRIRILHERSTTLRPFRSFHYAAFSVHQEWDKLDHQLYFCSDAAKYKVPCHIS